MPMQTLKVSLLRWYYRWHNQRTWRNTPFPNIEVSDETIPGENVNLRGRLYKPNNSRECGGLILFFHGGGWVIGDLDTHDPLCRQLAIKCGLSVFSVDYRRAPEYRYPTAANDCLQAAQWIAANRDHYDLTRGPLIVMGDSAGANLAGVVARELPSLFEGQCLIYPVTRHYNPFNSSYYEKSKGFALTSSLMIWFWDKYFPNSKNKVNANNAPLVVLDGAAPPKNLPATLVLTAENDPLSQEGLDYAQQVKSYGIPCEHAHFPNEQHGFISSEGASPGHIDAIERINTWIKELSIHSYNNPADGV